MHLRNRVWNRWNKRRLAAFLELNSSVAAEAVSEACRCRDPAIMNFLPRLMNGEGIDSLCNEIGIDTNIANAALWRAIGVDITGLNHISLMTWRRGAVKRVLAGETLSSVAKDYGVTKQTISIWLQYFKYTPPVVLNRREMYPKILELIKSGMTTRSIQDKLGCSRSAVTGVAKKEGLPLPRGRMGRRSKQLTYPPP